jgi:hypothetical protein
MNRTIDATVKGKPVSFTALRLHGVDVVVRGRLLRIGEVFDEYWLERKALPSMDALLDDLGKAAGRPDLFAFTQRVPDHVPAHQGHFLEWTNYAVLQLSSYEHWFERQIPASTRRNVRASEKRGVDVRVCDFDDAYICGISSIFNETPVRAGRRYWHFGKDIETVRKENGTYADRSIFLGAFVGEDMVGYLKVVCDTRTAAIMQILSKTTARDQRVNNALMAEAVRQVCARGIQYLLYEHFDYGNKTGDTLTRFKQSNGFERMDVPRYFVPLTLKGATALRLGLHHNLKERMPESIASRWRAWRTRWYARREATAGN